MARVLVEAKKRGLLDNVGAALQAMRDGGYWISDSIVDAALKQAGEKRWEKTVERDQKIKSRMSERIFLSNGSF